MRVSNPEALLKVVTPLDPAIDCQSILSQWVYFNREATVGNAQLLLLIIITTSANCNIARACLHWNV